MATVSFNKPKVQGREIDYIREAIELGQISGDGTFTKRCHALIEQMLGVKKALLTHSCTAALEMAAILLDLAAGDEVIMPSFTFVSTANAVCLRGATPVFVDIDPDTLNVSPEAIEAAITEKTVAIFVVHYAGVVCDMDAINAIADRHGLKVVEDAAQALGSTYKGRNAGTLGLMSAFSFHETKNIISGEGGALCINDTSYCDRAEILREKGTNRSLFFRGAVDKYTWVDIGSSYLPGEIISAFLYGQLEVADTVREGRLAVWHRYNEAFKACVPEDKARLPFIPAECEHNAHMYYLLFPELEDREAFREYLKSKDIMAPFHYVPLHSSIGGKKFGRTSGDLKVTDAVSDGLVRLPMYTMESSECERVIAAVEDYFRN